jgi:hypothetical protein
MRPKLKLRDLVHQTPPRWTLVDLKALESKARKTVNLTVSKSLMNEASKSTKAHLGGL